MYCFEFSSYVSDDIFNGFSIVTLFLQAKDLRSSPENETGILEQGALPLPIFFLGAIILIANKDSEMCTDYLEHLHYRSAFNSTDLQPSSLSEALSKPPSAAAHIRNETNLLAGPKFDYNEGS